LGIITAGPFFNLGFEFRHPPTELETFPDFDRKSETTSWWQLNKVATQKLQQLRRKADSEPPQNSGEAISKTPDVLFLFQ